MELPYNIFYFVFYAGYMPLLLYLPVYFKYIGLSPVYIGLLNGVRPILQSVGTPFLVTLGEKFHSRKLLFVISCLIMIGKVLIIFLLLHPSHQLCTVNYVNKSRHSAREISYSHFVKHGLVKRTPDTRLSIKKIPAFKDTFVYPTILRKSPYGEGGNFQNKSNAYFAKILSPVSSNNSVSQITPLPALSGAIEYFVINDEDEVVRIFVFLLLLALLVDWFDAAVFTIVDHSCAANVESERYGFVRLWGNVGWGVMTPVIGCIVSHFDHVLCGKVVGSFHYIFFVFIGFICIALFVGFNLDFTSTPPADVVLTKVYDPSSNFRYGLLLIAMSYSGFCNGFLFTFVNWFIDSLGGSALIMGIATACKCVVDMVLFFLLPKITNYIGHELVVNIGLLGHVGVFIVYFVIKDPWLVILAETFHGIVYIIVTSACVSFMDARSPAGSSSKRQAILQGIYWGFGTGIGALFGGYNLERTDFSETCAVFSVIASIVAIIFLLLQILSYFCYGKGSLDELSSSSNSIFGSDDEDDFNEDFESSTLRLMSLFPR